MRTVLLALALVAPFVASTAAGNGENVITFAAHEVQACTEGKTFCFHVTEGDPSALTEGSSVTVHVENEGDAEHNLFVATRADADPAHRATESSDAIAGTTGDVPPGETSEFTFTVPSGATGLYFWCDVEGHEELGMWVESTLASDGGNGNGEETNGGPVPAWAALVALVGAAMILVRRRRA